MHYVSANYTVYMAPASDLREALMHYSVLLHLSFAIWIFIVARSPFYLLGQIVPSYNFDNNSLTLVCGG